MKIKLTEIPEDGREYLFNRQTSELNDYLTDLIGNRFYEVLIQIRPLNNRDYTVNGKVITQTPGQCSRCGDDFEINIEKKLNEILIPAAQHERVNKYGKSSVSADEAASEVSVTEYYAQQFDLSEFVHEAIALEIPFTPHCPNCKSESQIGRFDYDEKMGEVAKVNPFSALKGIKLN